MYMTTCTSTLHNVRADVYIGFESNQEDGTMASRLAHPLSIPAEADLDLFEAMFALTDPVRRAIVHYIAQEPGTACSNSSFGVSKSALTRHWRVLRESGIIKAGGRRDAPPKLAPP